MARHLSPSARASVVLLAALLGFAGGASAEDKPVDGVLYSTGFEAGGIAPFLPGDLQGQGGWDPVNEGMVLAQQATAPGLQAVRCDQLRR